MADGSGEPPAREEAIANARALGLDRSDPVIRRYLAELMRLAIERERSRRVPGEDLASLLEPGILGILRRSLKYETLGCTNSSSPGVLSDLVQEPSR